MGAHRLKSFNTWPYMTSKGRTMMRGNIGTCRSKGFNGRPIVTCDNTIVTAKRRGLKSFDVWPIVTCDNAIVTAKRHGSRGFDVRPIVTCDDGIITAWVRGLKGFDTRLIVM